MVNANAINYFSPAKWVVSTVAGEGTHTTIAAALTSASSGDTIFIMPGTYTENITMKAGVNLSAFGSDGITPCQGSPFPVAVNVIIKGTVTATYTGQAAISGIQLRTNSATALSMTGSNACNLTFFGASIYALDGDGMTINNANAAINFYSCTCRYTTGFALFTVTATFGIDFENCTFQGTVSTSTIAAGRVVFNGCDMPGILITTSATGQVFANACYWQASGSTLLTTAGTVLSEIYNCFLLSGSASTISVGSGTTLNIATTAINSSNTNVITGAGTLNYGSITFVGTSSGINTSTLNPLVTLPSSGGSVTLTGDSGTASGSSLTVYSHNASRNCGSSVLFSNSGTTSTLNVTDVNDNTFMGSTAGSLSTTGVLNTGFGIQCLGALTSGSRNCGLGGSLANLTSGSYNCAIGYISGSNYLTSESSNICINSIGVTSESNTLRIGSATGSSATEINQAFICGIQTITVTGQPVAVSSSNQIGVYSTGSTGNVLTSNGDGTASFQTAGGGGGITTINGDSGSITGSTVTIYANNASANCGATVSFVNSGTTSTLYVSDGLANTLIGPSAGGLFAITSATSNTGLGSGCMEAISTADHNCALGSNSLLNLDTGSYNCAIGHQSGGNYSGAESSNITINAAGTTSESFTLRIGTSTGAVNQGLNQAFICGIQTIVVTGTPVLVSTSDQLGVAVSSIKFKKDVQDMKDDSSSIMSLRPVTFNWKEDSFNSPPPERQYGLIAEEVDKSFPYLCTYDKEGKPFSVKYHELPAILLNEIQKLRKELDEIKKGLCKNT